MKKDSALKIILFSIAALVVLWLAKVILFPTRYGMGIYVNGNFGGEHAYFRGGYTYGGGEFYFLLGFLVKALIVILVAALVIGILLYLKNNFFTQEDMAAIRSSFNFRNKSSVKKACSDCGREVNDNWKVCPHCGKDINI